MALPWHKFSELVGDPRNNLELLCRGLVQRNYGKHGQLRSRLNQPGVEFYLRLHEDCDLGNAGDCIGWQCRWYKLNGGPLGTKRRDRIIDAINKAKDDIHGLTDFVLCLHELPPRADLEWYFDLEVGVRLHLWADEEIETRLTGPAEILRQTYFGELVLTNDQLAESHERSIRAIRARWVPQLHVSTEVQETLERALLRSNCTHDLSEQAVRLRALASELRDGQEETLGDDISPGSESLAKELEQLSLTLESIETACDARKPAEAVTRILDFDGPGLSVPEVRRIARELRQVRAECAIAATTVEADIRHTLNLISEYRHLVDAPLFAIVGDAGRGKTQLAAELTAPQEHAPAGIFIKGSDLRSGRSLDELAARIPGINVKSFDELLEAVDAAGARNGVRIPIAIDGLNDSERPSEWQAHLAQLEPILDRYPHVLLVVTLRGAVREEALPASSIELELDWQRIEVEEAVSRYFSYYLINSGSAKVPMGLFRNPLFLRVYCDAVNPERQHPVGVEALPRSLVAMFDLYRERTSSRLRTRPGQPSLAPGHIEGKLAALALELWERGVRDLPFDDARRIIDGGDESDWDKSLLRALLEEGILLRDHEIGSNEDRVSVLFDLLSGYLIADAVVSTLAPKDFDETFISTELWEKLRGSADEAHPLADDILVALTGLIPRRYSGKQLWKLAPSDMREWALVQTLYLESNLVDSATVEALKGTLPKIPAHSRNEIHPFERLWEVRDGVNHKLNATFLDEVLQPLSVSIRDLGWSEWVRLNVDVLGEDLDEMEAHWTSTDERSSQDDLNARAVAWLLTTTCVPLRDRATRALQRFGSADPGRLFRLAASLLDTDDPYLVERLLGASFGAATSHQIPDPNGSFEDAFRVWLGELSSRFIGPAATSPTSHELARQYIASCFEFAARLHPMAIPEGVDALSIEFKAGPDPTPISADDENAEECDKAIRMDFENYLVGSLYENRGNYDMEHTGFLAGMAEVRGRIWDLGWRDAEFSDIDARIVRERVQGSGNQPYYERYGKKYGLIAYYELAGWLGDRNELRQRPWRSDRGVWPDIDPTFPETPGNLDIRVPAWAAQGPSDEQIWYVEGPVDIPEELLVPETIDGEHGPWVAVEGWLEHGDEEQGRRVWAFIRGVLVAPGEVEAARRDLEERDYLGNDYIPRSPSDYSTFAGEIPWSKRFEDHGDLENGLPPYHACLDDRTGESAIEIELLGHEYSIEASRTVTTLARGFWVPSHNYAARFDLRQLSRKLDLVDPGHRIASVTRNAPEGFEGMMLYLRRDLLAQYADGRRLLQVAWGEREIEVDWTQPPDWMKEARSTHQELWRHIHVESLDT